MSSLELGVSGRCFLCRRHLRFVLCKHKSKRSNTRENGQLRALQTQGRIDSAREMLPKCRQRERRQRERERRGLSVRYVVKNGSAKSPAMSSSDKSGLKGEAVRSTMPTLPSPSGKSTLATLQIAMPLSALRAYESGYGHAVGDFGRGVCRSGECWELTSYPRSCGRRRS